MAMANISKNAKVEITATAETGYIFNNWTDEDGAEVSDEASFEYTMPD